MSLRKKWTEWTTRLASRGSEYYADERELRRNTIVNRLILMYIIFTLIFIAILLTFYAILLERDFHYYVDYLFHYGFYPLLCLVLLTGTYLYRHRFGYPLLACSLAGIYGFAYMGWFGVLAGADTNIHFYILASVPFGFFIFDLRQKFLLSLWVLGTSALFLLFFVLVNRYGPIYPIPVDLAHVSTMLVLGLGVLNTLQVIYAFWREYGESEERMIDLNNSLSDRDSLIQMELDFAQDIQKAMLPGDESIPDNLQVAHTMLPLNKVSGDFFDVISAHGYTYILLCDISGHGIPAAMISMLAKQIFPKHLAQEPDPAIVMARVNEDICKAVRTAEYMTAVLVCIRDDGGLYYCAAGQSAGLIYDCRTKTVKELAATGPIVGALDRRDLPIPFRSVAFTLKEGDRIFLFTDGLVEQKSSSGVEYQVGIMSDLINTANGSGLQALHDDILSSWRLHKDGVAHHDDVTLVSLEYSDSTGFTK